MRRIARLGDHDARDNHRQHTHRDVDEEDPVPAQLLSQDATEQRADGKRHTSRSSPDADRRPALAGWKGCRDDRERRRDHDRRPHALHGACADEHLYGAHVYERARVISKPTSERGEGEDGEANVEHQPAPEQIGELATDQDESGEGERIGGNYPLELGDPEPEISLHRRQGDRDDRVVEHDHEQPKRDRSQRPPLTIRLVHKPHPRSLSIGSAPALRYHLQTCYGDIALGSRIDQQPRYERVAETSTTTACLTPTPVAIGVDRAASMIDLVLDHES